MVSSSSGVSVFSQQCFMFCKNIFCFGIIQNKESKQQYKVSDFGVQIECKVEMIFHRQELTKYQVIELTIYQVIALSNFLSQSRPQTMNTYSKPNQTLTNTQQQSQLQNLTQSQKTNQPKQVQQIQKLTQNLQISDQQQQPQKTQPQTQAQSEENNKSSQKQEESTELTETKYFININRTNIPFGKTTLFPGSIEEVDVVIELKDEILEDNTNNPFMLRVIAKCNNQEFNDLDQYVFSVRSNERFQYFEEVRFKIRKREKAQVKVAVKIPPVKQNYVIEGFLEVQLEELQPVCFPIVAKCEVPQITCIKDLFKPDEDTQVIKVPAKKNQIRMPPIPFKNLSNFNFTLQVEAISNESFQNKPYDIITQNFVNCQANTQFFVNLQLKENMSYKGPLPIKDTIRKILILKIKNSSVYFNYPLEVLVFEGSHGGGMS